MQGIRPLNNSQMNYLYLGTHKDEYYYILPDGRLASCCKSFFTDVQNIEEEQFTPEQLSTHRISSLNLSFIRFIKDFENKLSAIPTFNTNSPDNETLGGTSRIWYKGRAFIDDQPYNLEVLKSAKIPAIKSFILDLYEGKRPGIKTKLKKKKIVGIREGEDIRVDPELHIYATV